MAYEIRAMSFGEILDTAFRIVRNHFVPLVGCAAVIYVPLSLVSAQFQQFGDPSGGTGAPGPAALGGFLAVMLLFIVLSPIVQAAITHSIGEFFLGRSASMGEALRLGLSIVLPLLGTWLIAGIFIFIGFILLIVPGFILMLMWLLLTQVMVFERVFAFGAMGRSRELMRDNLLRGLGIIVLGFVVVSVLSWGVQLLAGWIPIAGPVLLGIVQAAGFAWTSSVMVLLYFDIRCRKEAFDLEHLSQLVAGSEAPPAPIEA